MDLTTGISHGWGAHPASRELVDWLRAHNDKLPAGERIAFHGFDAPTEITGAPARATSPRATRLPRGASARPGPHARRRGTLDRAGDHVRRDAISRPVTGGSRAARSRRGFPSPVVRRCAPPDQGHLHGTLEPRQGARQHGHRPAHLPCGDGRTGHPVAAGRPAARGARRPDGAEPARHPRTRTGPWADPGFREQRPPATAPEPVGHPLGRHRPGNTVERGRLDRVAAARGQVRVRGRQPRGERPGRPRAAGARNLRGTARPRDRDLPTAGR